MRSKFIALFGSLFTSCIVCLVKQHYDNAELPPKFGLPQVT
jgi:hypothetical protein